MNQIMKFFRRRWILISEMKLKKKIIPITQFPFFLFFCSFSCSSIFVKSKSNSLINISKCPQLTQKSNSTPTRKQVKVPTMKKMTHSVSKASTDGPSESSASSSSSQVWASTMQLATIQAKYQISTFFGWPLQAFSSWSGQPYSQPCFS